MNNIIINIIELIICVGTLIFLILTTYYKKETKRNYIVGISLLLSMTTMILIFEMFK